MLAWADMISMKALEVSENFLMSTGLGTLWGENREGQNPRGLLERLGQPWPWSEGGSWTEGGSAGPVTHSVSEQWSGQKLTLVTPSSSVPAMAPELPTSLFSSAHSLYCLAMGP